ncbi:MAG: DAK2 domain-containing protein [Clostridiales bacterium]|nr:DAK2 domain-containing protein [Clostridiales bacterium]
MSILKIDSVLYSKMLASGASTLNANKKIVNDLNVFPIPDGDTGDNMLMTVSSGSSAVSGESDLSLSEIAKRAADGMLLGARGNSGVILSRIFAGIAKGLNGVNEADLSAFGYAMKCGVEESYHAVPKPVEGTVLTVFKDSVNFANSKIEETESFEQYFDNLLYEMEAALERTPDQLDVLKEAGVVDSGGAGLVYITKGMKDAVNGIEVAKDEVEGAGPSKKINIDSFTEDSVMEDGYCTEFLLRLTNSKVDVKNFDENELFDYLNKVGESVVAFRDGSMIKVHVHTFEPGKILDHCQQYGEFLTLKIENMMLQHHETVIADNYHIKTEHHKKYGVVVVASGGGVVDTFKDLGADIVIEGGQTMNPPASAFIDAFKKVDADTIFVFPNNSNIVLTAKQAAQLYDKADIRIINSKTIGHCFVALSVFDSSMDSADEIEESLNEITSHVVTGMVSRAIRDTQSGGVDVKAGDYIGFEDDTILCDNPDREKALVELAEKLEIGNYDVALVMRGCDVPEDEAVKVNDILSSMVSLTEIIPIDGKQPIYDYIIVLE